MKELLEELIPWKENLHKNPVYKIYWLREPHCGQTEMVIDVFGGISYKCKHKMETINER